MDLHLCINSGNLKKIDITRKQNLSQTYILQISNSTLETIFWEDLDRIKESIVVVTSWDQYWMELLSQLW